MACAVNYKYISFVLKGSNLQTLQMQRIRTIPFTDNEYSNDLSAIMAQDLQVIFVEEPLCQTELFPLMSILILASDCLFICSSEKVM